MIDIRVAYVLDRNIEAVFALVDRQSVNLTPRDPDSMD
jgi:hypothetical protein